MSCGSADAKPSSPTKVSFASGSKESSPAPKIKQDGAVQIKQDGAVIDFFAAIEEEQPTMFNPNTNR